MAHSSQWIVNKRVLLVEYYGDVDKTELQTLNQELSTLLEEGEAPVHIISDNTQMGRMPFDLKTFQSTLSVLRSSKWGGASIVGADTMVRFFGQLVTNSFRLKIWMANSIDDAKAFLKKHDDSLPTDWV